MGDQEPTNKFSQTPLTLFIESPTRCQEPLCTLSLDDHSMGLCPGPAIMNEGKKGGVSSPQMEDNSKLLHLLDSANIKLSKNTKEIEELNCELLNSKICISGLEKKCQVVQGEAEEKARLIDRLQSELESATSKVISLRDFQSQAETLKIKLSECQRALTQGNAENVLASCAMEEFKKKEEYYIQLEDAYRGLEQKEKWEHERFQLLNNAHTKLKMELEGKKQLWDEEKTAMLLDMDTLQKDLDGNRQAENERHTELQRLCQLLALEERRRKAAEETIAELKAGLGNAEVIEGLQEKLRLMELHRDKQVGELEEKLSASMKNLNKKMQEVEEANSEKEGLIAGLGAAETILTEANMKNKHIQERIGILESANKVLEQKISTYVLQNEETGKTMEDMRRMLEIAESDLAARDSEIKSLQVKIDNAECQRASTPGNALASCALEEFKKKEEYYIQLEDAHRELKQKEKWEHERFQLLDNAHIKLKLELEEKKKLCDEEKTAMLLDMDTLQKELDSKRQAEKEVHSELERLCQLLALEERRRKAAEETILELKAGLGNAEAMEGLQEKVRLLELQREKEALEFEKKLSALTKSLNKRMLEVEEANLEKEKLIAGLGAAETTLAEVNLKNKHIQERIGFLESANKVLEQKISIYLLQNEETGKTREDMCKRLEIAESDLAARDFEIRNLQAKIDNADKFSEQLVEAESRVEHLENLLEAQINAVQEKEEKLSASEWTVQQLANEIGKIKSEHGQKEKQEVILHNKILELERQVREREGEVIEIECFMKNLVAEVTAKRAETEECNQKIADMEKCAAGWEQKEQALLREVKELESLFEEKSSALDSSELELRRAGEVREVMEAAITNLKAQLINQATAFAQKQTELEQLCEELQKTKAEEYLLLQQLKDQAQKLDNLERSSEEQVQKLQFELEVVNQERITLLSQLEISEERVKSLVEEIVDQQAIHKSMVESLSTRDRFMRDLEEKVIQQEALINNNVTIAEERTNEAEALQKQLQDKSLTELNMQHALVSLKDQLSALETREQGFLMEISGIQAELLASNSKLATKTRQMEQLDMKVKLFEDQMAREDDSAALTARLTEELKRCKKTAREQAEVVSRLQQELNETKEKLIVAENGAEMSKKELVKLQDDFAKIELNLLKETENVQSYAITLESLKAELTNSTQSANEREMLEKVKLDDAMHQINVLDSELKLQKAKVSTLESSNQKLHNDVEVAKEQGIARKQKLLQVLAQLENTNASSIKMEVCSPEKRGYGISTSWTENGIFSQSVYPTDQRPGGPDVACFDEQQRFLFDTLLRKTIGLEKQLEVLQRKNSTLSRQVEDSDSCNDENAAPYVDPHHKGLLRKCPLLQLSPAKTHKLVEAERSPLQVLQQH